VVAALDAAGARLGYESVEGARVWRADDPTCASSSLGLGSAILADAGVKTEEGATLSGIEELWQLVASVSAARLSKARRQRLAAWWSSSRREQLLELFGEVEAAGRAPSVSGDSDSKVDGEGSVSASDTASYTPGDVQLPVQQLVAAVDAQFKADAAACEAQGVDTLGYELLLEVWATVTGDYVESFEGGEGEGEGKEDGDDASSFALTTTAIADALTYLEEQAFRGKCRCSDPPHSPLPLRTFRCPYDPSPVSCAVCTVSQATRAHASCSLVTRLRRRRSRPASRPPWACRCSTCVCCWGRSLQPPTTARTRSSPPSSPPSQVTSSPTASSSWASTPCPRCVNVT
jgi:hypothetical protein